MPKVFLKNPKRTLLLALVIASAPSFAAYSDDADCAAVSNAAKNGYSQIAAQADQSAASTGGAIANTKSCIDQLLAQANRVVPNFGGGLIDTITKFASDLMLQQACSLISNTQSQTANVPTMPSISGIPAVSSEPATAPSPTTTLPAGTLWQRISNLF